MADIFLSYKRDERAAAEIIAERLRVLGLTVWFDASMRSGDAFDGEIDREARAAKIILVCWSPSARESEWVKSEAMIGFNQKKLAACYVAGPDGFDPPAPFNRTHMADLRTWFASPTDTDSEWKSVLRRVGDLCGRSDIESFAALDLRAKAADLRAWVEAHKQSPLFMVVDAWLTTREAQDADADRLAGEARARRAEEERARKAKALAEEEQRERAMSSARLHSYEEAERDRQSVKAREARQRSGVLWGVGLATVGLGVWIMVANLSADRTMQELPTQQKMLVPAEAPAEAPAEPTNVGCVTQTITSWSTMTIYAQTAGVDCQRATATISIRSSGGRTLWRESYQTEHLMTLAQARDEAAMLTSLREWVAPQYAIKTTFELPEWSVGAQYPSSGEFPFYPETDVTREMYQRIRAANAPMFCYVQGMESQRCLAWYQNALISVGVQSFPG